MQDAWKKWNELNAICKGKKVILWGRSEDWIHKTLPKLQVQPAYIIDVNEGYAGQSFRGMDIYSPDQLKQENPDDIYIVITASPYESVASQLEEFKLKPGQHFACSPAYYDFKLIQEIHRYDQKLLVSSPDYSEKSNHRYSKIGGGLFTYDVGSCQAEKVLDGHFRQMMWVDDHIFAIDFVDNEVVVLSKDVKVVEKFPLDRPNTCGIAYCSKREQIYITNAATDIINIYRKKDFKLVDTIEFSNKYTKRKIGQHHMNDICIVDDSLFVSCFSVSGNWKRNVLDGGIVEYDLDEIKKSPYVICQNLWQPHSVEFIDGSLAYLDSMRGHFYSGNQTIAGKFDGFLRGLTYDGRFYYVGQSETMYMSRLFGQSDNIMLNSGFYMFDVETKVSRFFSLMDTINIHDLLVLSKK